jgi:fibronectin type 3 domain-containing protein
MKNNGLLPLLAVLLLALSGCNHSGSGGYDPASDDPASDDPAPKTCVQFVNNNSIPVSVYADGSQYQKIADVEADSSSFPIERTPEASAHFYHVYRFSIDGWEFPYYDEGLISEINEGIIARVDAEKTTTIPIPLLSGLSSTDLNTPVTSKTYLRVENAGTYSLLLTHGNSEENPQGTNSPILNAGETGAYLVSAGPVSGYQFKRNAVTPVDFPAALTAFEAGHLYSIKHENSGLSLVSDIPLTIAQVLASVLPAPWGLFASAAGSDSIELSWSAVEGAAGYNVYRSDSAEGTYAKVNASLITTAAYADTGLSAETTYYYKVSAISGGGGEGAKSGYAYATTSSSTLSAPTVVSATAYSGYIYIAWSSVSGASYYNVYRATTATGTYSLMGTTSSTDYYNGSSYDGYSLSSGTTYYYKVSAVSSSGTEGVLSIYTYATASSTLSAPNNVSATALSSSSISLSWNSVSGASSYRIYYSTTGTRPSSYTYSTTSTSYTVTGLSSGTTYYFWVCTYSSSTGSTYFPSSYVYATTSSSSSGSAPSLSWSTYSGSSWSQQSTNYYKSTNTADGSSSWLRLTVTASSACTIAVMLTAYSEERFDYALMSSLDGSTSSYLYRVSGNGSSQSYTYSISAGTHYIYFGYTKDGSVSQNGDYATVQVTNISS